MALTGNELVSVTGVVNSRPAGQQELVTTNAIASLAAGGPGGLGVLTLNGATSGTTTLTPAAIASGVWTIPNATDTIVGKATTDTLTNKTLTAPVLSGSVTGTYTLAGTPTITLATLTTPAIGSAGGTFAGSSSGTTTLKASAIAAGTQTLPAVTGVLQSTTGANLALTDIYRTSAPVTKNANVTYANVTGLSATVVPGTYSFRCVLPSTVASGTGGIKYAFNYTTTVLSALESTAKGFTASAVAVQHTTTTTTQTDLFTQAAVVILVEIEGTMVVGTGGTIDVQVAQNTSDSSNTVALLGGSFTVTRIA